MMQTLSKRSMSESIMRVPRRLSDVVKSLFSDKLVRTKGVEVEMLQDDEDRKICIWELAGQDIFRSLQDIISPTTNQTFAYVFAFSHYSVKDNKRLPFIDRNVYQRFQDELKQWLRFIVSNSQISSVLSQVVIPVTHKDRLKKDGFDKEFDIKCLKDIVADVQKKYSDVADI